VADVFNDYARYYDLLYKEKDYAAEALYIHGLIQKHKPGARTILNLGCGTGKHDACLERLNYRISGVDFSDTMLVEAHKRTISDKLEFFKGDARSVELGKKFDVVISLFHVISYQTMEEDILAVFRTAEKHLAPGGIFIFDFWHGEGVLNDPPVVRVKRLEDDMIRVMRVAEPLVHKDKRVVDVYYQIIAFNKKDAQWSELKEKHSMRYFFLPEISAYLLNVGFTLDESLEWMSKEKLSMAWYGVVVASKKL